MYRLASISTIILTLSVAGCASDKCAESDCGDTAASVQGLRADTDGDLMELEQARSGWEGTPEGVGLLDFINAADTTQNLLDYTVGLDRRAAGNLTAVVGDEVRSLLTAGAPAALRLIPDRAQITADRADLSYVTVPTLCTR